MTEMHYHDYLQLDKILSAQQPESLKQNAAAHDEMLFIITHQTYELWFKQLHHEADSVLNIMRQPALNDNSPQLQTVVHRLQRMTVILRVLIQQIDVLETMTPMDFLDFRDLLRPASGFQSWQFKLLEAKLGLKFEHRHAQEYYISQLRPHHIDLIKKAESEASLLQQVNLWLERMPFFENNIFSGADAMGDTTNWGLQFWKDYKTCYFNSLAEVEKNNFELFDKVFFHQQRSGNTFSACGKQGRFIYYVVPRIPTFAPSVSTIK